MERVSVEAQDSEVMLSDNSRKRLSSFWLDRPVALIFPRHFGCPFGRRQVVQLRREQNELKKAKLDVVLFSSGSPAQAEVFRHGYEVPFPIVCDPDCVLFKKYGLRDMSPRDYYSPIMLMKVVKVLAQGYGHQSGQGSSSQLGGVFIIDTGATVRFAHIAANAADHPSPQEIIQAAATINRQGRAELEGGLP
jgi:peroxiredoxin